MVQTPRPAARFLEMALLFNFVIHAVAMASMGLLLLPGTPGGNAADLARRAGYVAQHPWLWRVGWFPWQMTALADLLLGIALLVTPWIPRWPARIAALLTLAAIVPDQSGQFLWVTHGVHLAQEAVRTRDFSGYAHFEAAVFQAVAAWGCLGYLAGAIGWTWCFAAAGTWSRLLTWLSVATWGVFGVSTICIFLPPAHRPAGFVAAGGNAVGFILLQLWLLLVLEQVLRRARPDSAYGAWKPWRAPGKSPSGRCSALIANSRFARRIGELFPPPALRSDIRDVVYINYLVASERLEKFVPAGLELQRLGPNGRYAMFSILTYRHGHFGPRILGAFRRCTLSPVQSNWRLYVTDPRTGHAGVYFLTTAISSSVYALAGRLLSEGVPMHRLKSGHACRTAAGEFEIAIDPGAGSAPDLRASLHLSTGEPALPAAFRECFANYREFLAHCVPQDRALAPQPWYARTARQEITLGIPLEACVPLQGTVESKAAAEITGGVEPVCFTIPSVTFRFDREYLE
ncbi:MAG TPA: DUF2071 domain-containing protein [Tepidisphaeraceae bacterium]|jgi:hypothetical protein|nr:DUF2071 domain-containing protein [Tepidisphaeraceae bacterium]